MRLVISHADVKREIVGPFAVCGSREDIQRIKDACELALAKNFSYGWIDVCERAPLLADTAPIRWDEAKGSGGHD